MTLEQADAARRRAVRMLENFGDSDGAAEFDAMTAEGYAEREGIEIIASNPTPARRKENNKMAKVVELEDAIRDIADKAKSAGPTRAEMNEALEEIVNLCIEALPELDESEEDESDTDDKD